MGNFVCPLCHGCKTIVIKINPCDVPNIIKNCHLYCCLCGGAGYYHKEILCTACGGKGYRDWVDVIRRPYLGDYNATNKNLL